MNLSLFQFHAAEHLCAVRLMQETLEKPFNQILDVCLKALKRGRKILFFGNGGSAADAQHLAAELVVRFETDRRPLAAIALTTDTSVLTACANDYGFEQVFARQIKALGHPGDVAIALTTSGTSSNILKALEVARSQDLTTIAFTSFRGEAALKPLVDLLLVAPSLVTARAQEMHILLGHILCAGLEAEEVRR